MKKEKMLELLKDKFPKLIIRQGEEDEHWITVCEGSEIDVDAGDDKPTSIEALGYYEWEMYPTIYGDGLHVDLDRFLESKGWMWEWENPGAVILTPDL